MVIGVLSGVHVGVIKDQLPAKGTREGFGCRYERGLHKSYSVIMKDYKSDWVFCTKGKIISDLGGGTR